MQQAAETTGRDWRRRTRQSRAGTLIVMGITAAIIEDREVLSEALTPMKLAGGVTVIGAVLASQILGMRASEHGRPGRVRPPAAALGRQAAYSGMRD